MADKDRQHAIDDTRVALTQALVMWGNGYLGHAAQRLEGGSGSDTAVPEMTEVSGWNQVYSAVKRLSRLKLKRPTIIAEVRAARLAGFSDRDRRLVPTADQIVALIF